MDLFRQGGHYKLREHSLLFFSFSLFLSFFLFLLYFTFVSVMFELIGRKMTQMTQMTSNPAT